MNRVSTAPTARRRLGRAAPAEEDREAGQVMLLSIGYGLLALLLVFVVVSATAVYLARKELLALADLAALEAADAMSVEDYYAAGTPPNVHLSDDAVRAAVEDYLAQAPRSGRLDDVTIVSATAVDSRTASVTLHAVADIPFLTVITAAWSDGVELQVTADARAD